MERHTKLSDEEFKHQFKTGEFRASWFSHEAHLRLAWIHITTDGIDSAIENICTQIKAFALANGAADKYNITVTIAAIRAVNHFIIKSSSDNFDNFNQEFPELRENFRGLLDSHYSENIFTSEKAKKQYLPPDISPFD